MKPKLIVFFLLLLLLPMAALLWLGREVVTNQGDIIERRFQGVIQQKLSLIDEGIGGLLEQRKRMLSKALGNYKNHDYLRKLSRSNPYITQTYLITDKGELGYPTAKERGSTRELRFIERTRHLWEGKIRFWETTGEEGSRKSSHVMEGFHRWYWAQGVNLLFWKQLADGSIVGAELHRSRLVADVIALLPTAAPTSSLRRYGQEDEGGGVTALINAEGDVLYQWGRQSVDLADRTPRVSVALSEPLSTWRLAYYHEESLTRGFEQGFMVNAFIVGLAYICVIGGCAFYFYREQSRDMRDASQRVLFVNQVSHELKTPLTNIRLYAELLRDRIDEEDPKALKYHSIIDSESQRLSRLIGNILTFARKQRKGLTLQLREGSIDEVILRVVENFSESLSRKNIKMSIKTKTPSLIKFDHDAFEQILGNLLSNVEKYVPSEGAVSITSWEDATHTVICVKDTGAGIPPSQREKIFEPFYRMSNKLSDGVSGTGIGLSIARDLTRLHGGDLELAPHNDGAEFIIRLSRQSDPGVR